MHFLSLAMCAVLSPTEGKVPKGQQRSNITVSNKPHVAARATITTIGSTPRGVSLAPEPDTTRAPIATLNMHIALVYETRHGL